METICASPLANIIQVSASFPAKDRYVALCCQPTQTLSGMSRRESWSLVAPLKSPPVVMVTRRIRDAFTAARKSGIFRAGTRSDDVSQQLQTTNIDV